MLGQHPGQSGDVDRAPALALVRRAGFLCMSRRPRFGTRARDLLSPYWRNLRRSRHAWSCMQGGGGPERMGGPGSDSQALNPACAAAHRRPRAGGGIRRPPSAFELMEVKSRRRSRGKRLNRYRMNWVS